MTMHTRAATDDIYEIFNAPLKQTSQEEDDSVNEDEGDETDGDYTTDAESNGTTRHLSASERGDDDDDDDKEGVEDDEDARSMSEWSDFTARKHIPRLDEAAGHDNDDEDATHLSEAARTMNQDPESEYNDGASFGDNEGLVETTASPEHSSLTTKTRTSFIPLPPEDYDPPTRPFRDPTEVANNRLPFMTPITERTEVSLEVEIEQRLDQFKTPSKRDGLSILADEDEDSEVEQLSSPLQELLSIDRPKMRAETPPKALVSSAIKPLSVRKGLSARGPIVKDTTCNPMDDEVRIEILTNTVPHLSSYQGLHDHTSEKYSRGYDIRKFAKALAKNSKGSADRTLSPPAPVTIELPDTTSAYTVRRELGSGAFAPVYLVENSNPGSGGPDGADQDENAVVHSRSALRPRSDLEALKMEDPPTAWEFYMIRVAHSRLGPQHRASASLTYAHELHLYQDEAFLFLPFHPHGTLLDVVNLFRNEASGVMDEQLAMFFTVELLRTVEALHAKQVIHGDIKPDNCLLRLDSLNGGVASLDSDALRHAHAQPPSSQWRADGSGGWDQRGLTLIDFGRGIDMRAFENDVQFIADWKTTSQDCAEMREGRPWTWQIDYHGLAGTIHCLLFGKYIETVRCDQGSLTRGGRRYRIRESLKRYWQTDLWGECFEILLNPASCLDNEVDQRMPVLKSMRSVRVRKESWLEENSERGVGLRSLISKLETYAKARKW
jgi:checkpoint serine/threonine-protein kinase